MCWMPFATTGWVSAMLPWQCCCHHGNTVVVEPRDVLIGGLSRLSLWKKEDNPILSAQITSVICGKTYTCSLHLMHCHTIIFKCCTPDHNNLNSPNLIILLNRNKCKLVFALMQGGLWTTLASTQSTLAYPVSSAPHVGAITQHQTRAPKEHLYVLVDQIEFCVLATTILKGVAFN